MYRNFREGDDWDDDEDDWDDDGEVYDYLQEVCPLCHSPDINDVSLDDGLLSVGCETCGHDWYEIEYYTGAWESDASWSNQTALVAQENQKLADKGIAIAESPLHGRGLFATQPLPKGYDLGTLSLIFDNWFLDTSYGRYINHSPQPNVELYHVYGDDHIKVGGRTNQPVAAGTELTANYADPLAPKPNFIAPA